MYRRTRPPRRTPRPLPAALTVLLTVLAAAFAGAPGASAVTLVPSGVPARPAAPATPDSSLTDHSLTYAAGPLDNPDKGLAVYYSAGSDQNTGYPHSLTWSYFPLSAVMTDAGDCSKLDWTPVEKFLDDTAAAGNTAAMRFYLDYPSGSPANGMPSCWDGKVSTNTDTYYNTQSPDYNNAFLLSSLQSFIAAFGAKYDGDPRIGFLQMGLIGFWGEWHTYPYNGSSDTGLPNYMPTDANAALIIKAYDNAFDKTQVEVRYPSSGGGATDGADVGYHDDSFCGREGSPPAGVSLPQSMGGASYSFGQLELNEGTENRWITDSIGGEVLPTIQTGAFNTWGTGANGTTDDMRSCVEMEHPTWELDQAATGYSSSDANVNAAVREMGYDFTVPDAYYKNSVSDSATVGVKITNDGTAPFYYPWTVRLGLKDSSGNVVKTWNTSWDLTKVMPQKIRAFPDWNAGSDPTYLDYGYSQYFQTDVDTSGVTNGSYQLVMDVVNPLSAVSSAAKTMRFANATQNADGWLGLGAISVAHGTSTGTSASYEAEASGNTLTGGAVVASCSGCSGGKAVGYLGNGATLTFNHVDGGTGGSRTITLAYASAVARTVQVSANGGTPVSVTVKPTADWQTTATSTVTLTLASGTSNTIELANATDWAPDIDRITVG